MAAILDQILALAGITGLVVHDNQVGRNQNQCGGQTYRVETRKYHEIDQVQETIPFCRDKCGGAMRLMPKPFDNDTHQPTRTNLFLSVFKILATTYLSRNIIVSKTSLDGYRFLKPHPPFTTISYSA